MTAASSPASPGESQSTEPILQAEQIRLLFRFSLVGYLATLMVVLILGALLWQEMSRPALFAWFVAISLVTVGRYLIYKSFIAAAPSDDAVVDWEKRFLLGSVPDKISHHAPCSVLIVRTD